MAFMDNVEMELDYQGITQKKLAEDLGLRRPTLSDWKKNGAIPAGDICIKIADYLGVSVEWLITGKVKNENPEISLEEKKLLVQWSHLTLEQKDTISTLLEKWEADYVQAKKENA
ncbi:MAG: helix-turn-helix transcriptional regulator [Treponema sp.]|nr:helix-turn-helix transcriptional regulator [Treponema sp.]